MDNVSTKINNKSEGFGDRLKRLRINRGLSQTELAESVGLRYAHIGRYERGQSKPSSEMLRRLSDILGVSTDYLLNGTEEDAAVADLKDRDLLNMFKEVDSYSQDEKEFIKKVLDALLTKKRIQKLAS
jgi:transcriptional regulator with XRE-family HTH domain